MTETKPPQPRAPENPERKKDEEPKPDSEDAPPVFPLEELGNMSKRVCTPEDPWGLFALADDVEFYGNKIAECRAFFPRKRDWISMLFPAAQIAASLTNVGLRLRANNFIVGDDVRLKGEEFFNRVSSFLGIMAVVVRGGPGEIPTDDVENSEHVEPLDESQSFETGHFLEIARVLRVIAEELNKPNLAGTAGDKTIDGANTEAWFKAHPRETERIRAFQERLQASVAGLEDCFRLSVSPPSLLADAAGEDRPEASNRKPRGRLKWLTEAMLLVQKHPDYSDARIAKGVGVHKSTLCRDKTYRQAARLARVKSPPPQGFKDNKTGELEAWENRSKE